MKKSLTTFILISLITLSFAQNSLLWKITGNELEQPSYLYGTIHVICPADFFLPEQVSSKMKISKQLILEVDISDPAMMQTMQTGMVNPQMKNIKADLSEADIKTLDKALMNSLGAGIDQMGILKPWALSTMLSLKLALECDQPAQYEVELLKLAKANNLPLIGLETIQEQLTMFDNIPYDEQIDMLMESVNDSEKNKVLFQNMVATYKTQDVDKLYEFILEQDEMEDFAEILLDNRNKKWLPILAKEMRSKSCFIAVGAGHLAGKQGVIQLLRSEGYTVLPIK